MTEPRRNGEFHHADPAYRKRMLVFLAVTVIVGAIGLVALQYWLTQLTARLGGADPYLLQTWLQRVLAGMCLLLAASGGTFAIWIYRMAKQTRLERRWPPARMRTAQDVRIRYLTSADALVSQLMAASAVLTLVSAAIVAWAVWLLWLA
jgi:hypothetical protein